MFYDKEQKVRMSDDDICNTCRYLPNTKNNYCCPFIMSLFYGLTYFTETELVINECQLHWENVKAKLIPIERK